MSTSNQQAPTPQWWNDRTILRYHLARSNYVTASWNWFMMLAGKAAEPFLFASVLYSGYKLLPGVPQPSSGLDAFMFVAQQATLDIGGMGLMKLAQQANQDKHSFAYRVGFILVGLMIANVVMASLERLIPLGGAVTIIEGVLLVARAIMAVLYGHAVHSLRGDAPEATEVVKTVDVHRRLDALTDHVQGQQGQLDTLSSRLENLSTRLGTLTTSLSTALSTVESHVTRLDSRLLKVDSQLAEVEQGQGHNFSELQQSLRTVVIEVHEATIRELTPLIEQVSTAHQPTRQPHGVNTQRDRQPTKGRQLDTPINSTRQEEQDTQVDRGKIIRLSSGSERDTRGRQAEVMAYILDFMRREQREPTLSEIMNVTSCAKQTAVNARKDARETVHLDEESQAADNALGRRA